MPRKIQIDATAHAALAEGDRAVARSNRHFTLGRAPPLVGPFFLLASCAILSKRGCLFRLHRDGASPPPTLQKYSLGSLNYILSASRSFRRESSAPQRFAGGVVMFELKVRVRLPVRLLVLAFVSATILWRLMH
jgi:hypothetical protein